MPVIIETPRVDEGANLPLFEAATHGDPQEVAAILLTSGDSLDLEAKKGDGKTALHLAAENGRGEVVRMLLEHGSRVDTTQRPAGLTALHMAATEGHTAVMRILLEYGARADAVGRFMTQAPLHLAARNGHDDAVEVLLEKGAAAELPDACARTPLHEAALAGWPSVVRRLLAVDAYVDPRDDFGRTPLVDAARRGHVDVVRLLLANGADVDAGVREDVETPLIAACQGPAGSADVAHMLLEAGASVERRDAHGATALRYAARAGNLPLARLLLEHAADPASLREDSREDSGIGRNKPSLRDTPTGSEDRSIEKLKTSSWETTSTDYSYAKPRRRWLFWGPRPRPKYSKMKKRWSTSEEATTHAAIAPPTDEPVLRKAMKNLLDTPQKLHGPPIRGPLGGAAPPRRGVSFVTPPQWWEVHKQRACETYAISMLQFCVGGAQEIRLSLQATVREVLYGRGPSALLEEARFAAKLTEDASFTWFHIPANNLTWAEHLITRLREEGQAEAQGPDGITRRKWRRMDKTTRAQLNFAQPRRQGQSFSFLKSMSHTASIPTSDGSATEQAAVLVLPYLHFETASAFEAMMDVVGETNVCDTDQRRRLTRPDTGVAVAPHGKRQMANEVPEEIKAQYHNEVTTSEQPEPDVMEGQPFTFMAGPRYEANRVSSIVSEAQKSFNLESHMQKAWSTGYTPSDYAGEASSHRTLPQRTRRRYRKRALDPATARALPLGGYDLDTPPHATAPTAASSSSYHWAASPGASLLRGYLSAGAQPRRSLDQCRYTDTRKRDADQVIARRCRRHRQTPKLFVVDQLWLWVLGSHTLVTCAASTWDPRALPRETAGETDPETGRPAHEAMHVQKALVNYLRRPHRTPVLNVHALASLAVRQCVDMFHQGNVPRCLNFFDFFEETVASVADDVASLLRDMRARYEAKNLATIGMEMRKLIEVGDILDELHMLHKVLAEQSSTVLQYSGHVIDISRPKEDCSSGGSVSMTAVPTEVPTSHMARITAMQKHAEDAQKMLYRIMDWKQKHNSHREAVAAGRQAKAAAKQAKTTAKQSNAILLFTVITIVFLPVSFMAAFFAIPVDSFTSSADSKLQMSYVLKCMASVGVGLSVPFVLVALNLDRTGSAFNSVRRAAKHLWTNWIDYVVIDYRFHLRKLLAVAITTVIIAAILAPVWTSHLASGAKLAVTVTVAVLAMVGIVGAAFLYYWRRQTGWDIDTDISTSVDLIIE